MNIQRLLYTYFVHSLICIAIQLLEVDAKGEVIWAVNAGGDGHVDSNGVKYQKDPAKVGVSSDYGKSLMIQRVGPTDQILYQTERYHTSSFGYDVPITKDGDYVLILKFSEVWFAQADQKVFSVMLNGHHMVVEDLDIFAKVGRGIAHDEIVPFQVKGNTLKVGGESSIFENKLSVEFVKQHRDNPKINALYVMRGKLEDVPMLAPWPGVEQREEEEEEDDLEDEVKKARKKRPMAGPKVQDPYAADDTGSMMLPVFVAIGMFIPLLFCLCKL